MKVKSGLQKDFINLLCFIQGILSGKGEVKVAIILDHQGSLVLRVKISFLNQQQDKPKKYLLASLYNFFVIT